MRDDNYLDGLIACGTVAISFAGLILLIVSNLKNEAETEKTAFYEWADSHCEKIEKNLNVTENSKTFKCDDGKIYTIKW